MTYAELKARLRDEAFPEGLAVELAPAVYSYLRSALIDLQRVCPRCLQENHADVHPFKSVYWQCGTSVICSPPGKPYRVYTVGDNSCQPVDYVRHDYQYLRQWSRSFARRSGTPDNAGLPTLPLGLKYPKDTTDWLWGRAGYGVWATENDKLIVAPWIQSIESIIVEWRGMKTSWNDDDVVTSGKLDDDTWFNALVSFVLARKAKVFDADYGRHNELIADYDNSVSQLMCDCQDQTENVTPTSSIIGDSQAIEWENWRNRAAAQAAAAASGTTVSGPSGAAVEVPLIMAIIGDYGLAGADELAVSTLVKSWEPNFIVTTGDNNYPDGSALTIDANVGQYYAKYIQPYKGSYPLLSGEVAVTTNSFWPSLGNHDLDSGFPPTAYTSYFTLPGNGRFYSFINGLCEFFIIDSGINTAGTLVEPAGNTEIDYQASWLQARLAASVAAYKIVAFHHPPYTSDESYYPGIASLRWPFKKWGATAVFNGHGHNYEHVIDSTGMDYFICGASGAELRCFAPTPVDGSQKRYCESHGAIRISILCASLTIEFINVDGEVIDTVVIANENAGMSGGSTSPCVCTSTTIVTTQGFFTADNIALGRQFPALSTNRMLSAFGAETPGDGGGRQFFWKPDSYDADNGTTILKPATLPDALPGRWWVFFGG